MKKNLYYRAIYCRKSSIVEAFLDLFFALGFYPRLMLEVLIRKNFGERYFSMSNMVVMLFFLCCIPFGIEAASNAVSYYGGERLGFFGVISKHFTWFAFMAAILYCSIQRYREIRKSRSTFDFTKFSKYQGDALPQLRKIKINGKELNVRDFEILIEPAPFLLAGIILVLFHQIVGLLLIVSSVIYSLSYIAAYRRGDHFVLDKIDEIIANNRMYESFVDGADAKQTDGFQTKGRKPANAEFRRKIADASMIDDHDDEESIAH